MRVGRDELTEERIESSRRNAGVPALESGLHRRHELLRVTSGLRRDVHARCPRHMAEVPFDLSLEVEAAFVIEQIPFVECQHHGTSRLDGGRDDADVLLAQRVLDLHEDEGHLGAFERGLRTQCGIEVGAAGLMSATADAGGVDEAPLLPTELDELVDGVTSGAGDIVHEHPVGADELVEQGRLADVRATDEGHTTRSALFDTGVDGRDLGQDREHFVEQVGDSPTVQSRDGPRLAETQAPEFGGHELAALVIDLVRSEEHRLLLPAQHLHDHLIGRGRTGRGIDDEEDGIGHVHGDLGLDRNPRGHALRVLIPPAGVDEGEFLSVPFRPVAHAVTGDSRNVLDDGFTTTEDAVDQRRLADVGTADDRDLEAHPDSSRRRARTADQFGHKFSALAHVLRRALVIDDLGKQRRGILHTALFPGGKRQCLARRMAQRIGFDRQCLDTGRHILVGTMVYQQQSGAQLRHVADRARHRAVGGNAVEGGNSAVIVACLGQHGCAAHPCQNRIRAMAARLKLLQCCGRFVGAALARQRQGLRIGVARAVRACLCPVIPGDPCSGNQHHADGDGYGNGAVTVPQRLSLVLAELLVYFANETVVRHRSPASRGNQARIFHSGPYRHGF